MIRNILILVGVAVLVIVGLIFVPKLQPKSIEETPQPTFDSALHTFSNYATEDVVQVKLNYNGEVTELFYDKTNDKYTVLGYEDIEVDISQLKSIFRTAGYIEAEEIVSEDLSNIAEYGLDKPIATITALYSDGKSNVIYIGDNPPGRGTYYAIVKGVDKVITLWNNYGNNAKVTINDLRIIEKISFELTDLKKIHLYKDGNTLMELTNTIDGSQIGISTWSLSAPYYKELHTSDSSKSFSKLTQLILAIEPSKVLSAEGDFANYELDNPWGMIELTPINGEAISMLFGKITDGNVAMKYSNSDIIYSISQNRLSLFEYKTIDIIERLLILINVKNVISIELNGVVGNNKITINHIERKDNDGNVKLDGNGNPIEDIVYIIEGKELSEDEEKQGPWFYQALLIPRIVREVEDDNYDPGKKVGYIKWNLKLEQNEFIINIYEYDEYFYAVDIQDNGIFLLIRKTDLDRLPGFYEMLKKGEMIDPYQ